MKNQLKIRRSDYAIFSSYLLMGFLACSVVLHETSFERLIYHLMALSAIIILYLPGWFLFKSWVFRFAPWKRDWAKRVRMELIWSSLSGVYFSISYLLTLVLLDSPGKELDNSTLLLIAAVFMWAAFVNVSGEFLHLIGTARTTQTKLSIGQNEILKLRKEVLQDLISPHFLFNSLNTISTFVTENKAKSIRIVKELSEMYRFILKNSHKSVVSLQDDLELANRYAFLLQSRLEKGIEIIFDVDEQYLDYYVPPLSLQNLIENAVKHNVVTKKNTLKVEIQAKDDTLSVRNNMIPKMNSGGSTGLGLNYIGSQIEQLSGKKIQISSDAGFYEVSIPLMAEESLRLHDIGEEFTLQKLS